jgi:hypothetical protein
MSSAIVYCDISDHYPVALHVDLIPEKYNPNTGTSQKMRVFTSDAIEEFVHDLSTHDWNEVIHNFVNHVDPNISYDWFATKFKDIFCKHFPEKTKTIPKKLAPRHEWITTGLAKACNKKSVLYKKFKRQPTLRNKLAYTIYRNKLKSILTKAEREFYRNKFKLHESNLLQTWKLLKTILKSNNDNCVVQ